MKIVMPRGYLVGRRQEQPQGFKVRYTKHQNNVFVVKMVTGALWCAVCFNNMLSQGFRTGCEDDIPSTATIAVGTVRIAVLRALPSLSPRCQARNSGHVLRRLPRPVFASTQPNHTHHTQHSLQSQAPASHAGRKNKAHARTKIKKNGTPRPSLSLLMIFRISFS